MSSLSERIPVLARYPNSYRLLRGQALGVTPTVTAAASYGSVTQTMPIILLGYLPESQAWMFTPWYSTRLDGRKFRVCPAYIPLGAGGVRAGDLKLAPPDDLLFGAAPWF